jgi:hypothetical protein
VFEHLFKINGFPGRKAVCQPTVQARRMAIHQSTDIDNVRALLAAGLSRSQIGDRLGMTRSTVGGLIYRMKAKGVAVPRRLPRPQSVKAKPQCDHSMRSTGTRDLPVEVTADAVPLIDISPRGCHWPVAGEGIATLFCGADRGGHRSYCRQHAMRSVRVDEPVGPKVMASAW